MDEQTFYIDDGGETCGPLSLEQLAELLAEGIIGDNTLYAVPGASEWLPVSRLSLPRRSPPIIAPPVIAEKALSLILCKTCSKPLAPSAQTCVHCGQKWPCLNLICPHCSANDFDFCIQDNSPQLWIPLTVESMLTAALFESFQSRPEIFILCNGCGARYTASKEYFRPHG
jgi:hypothetical protein